jgi:hypothetical protein
MVSIFGVLVRPRTVLAILVVLLAGAVLWIWVATSSSPLTRQRDAKPVPIQNLYPGLSFSSGEDSVSRVVTYTFPVENYNSSVIYLRRVGRNMPGLTLVKTLEWSTQRPDQAGSSLSETMTYRVGDCSLIPHESIDATLQARTLYGRWQTIRLSLMGAGNQQWQLGLVQQLCPALSR